MKKINSTVYIKGQCSPPNPPAYQHTFDDTTQGYRLIELIRTADTNGNRNDFFTHQELLKSRLETPLMSLLISAVVTSFKKVSSQRKTLSFSWASILAYLTTFYQLHSVQWRGDCGSWSGKPFEYSGPLLRNREVPNSIVGLFRGFIKSFQPNVTIV
jgi:hypothetical protein